jgi:hypothetical protein
MIYRYTVALHHIICKSIHLPLLIGVLAGASRAQTPQTDKTVSADYRIGGQRMGTYAEARRADGMGGVLTTIDSDMVFNRLGNKLELKSTSTYHETSLGDLTAVESSSSSSQEPTIVHAVVANNTVDVTTTAGGHSYERQLSFSGKLLGPDGAKRAAVDRLRQKGNTFSYQTYIPELGSVVTVTDAVVATEDSVEGQSSPAIKVEQSITGMPAPVAIWLDNSGWMVRQVMSSPLGDIEALRSNSTAAATAIAGAILPEETFNRSIVTSNIRLPEERLIERLKIKIISRNPAAGWPDFSADNQTVLEKTPNHVVLELRRIAPEVRGARPVASTGELNPYLAPNALLQSDDTEVRQIESDVVHDKDDAWKAALELQRWTAENMHFDLGIAIVPASEVARNHRGTCFGYSVLLGSLMRAAGIPSRVRIGLVYAGGIWGGHAWDEVRIGDSWIPIDGALYAPGPADAARFSVYTSSLAEGTLGNLGGLGQVLGNVDIKILEYTVNGKTTVVPDDAKPYSIEGNVYRNPWLGLTITKPASFTFTGFDLAWPQTTVVAMQGANGQRIEIHDESASLPSSVNDRNKFLKAAGVEGQVTSRRIAGHNVEFAEEGQIAGVLLERRGTLWLIKATGPESRTLLIQVLSSMKW